MFLIKTKKEVANTSVEQILIYKCFTDSHFFSLKNVLIYMSIIQGYTFERCLTIRN